MILFALILFKIVPEKHKRKALYNQYYCQNVTENKDFTEVINLHAYLECKDLDINQKVIFENCTYSNIDTDSRWDGLTYYGFFFFIKNSNLDILNCKFITVKCCNRFVSFEKDNGNTLNMYSNTITDFTTYGNSEAQIIYTVAKYNNFISNTITNSAKEVFRITNNNNLNIKYNTIINAPAPILGFTFSSNDSPPDSLVMEHNTFKDCNGDNNKIFYIDGMTKNYTLNGFTFDNCVNKVNNKNSYIVSFINKNDDLHLTLKDCKFLNLLGNVKGGIGLWFADDEQYESDKHQILTFIDCVFKNVRFETDLSDADGTAGGAISFEENAMTDSQTDLTIKRCNFTNVSTNKEGGAIYYVSKRQLTIDGCHFEKVYSGDYKSGNAIYIEKKVDDTTTVSITWCTFTDCGNDREFHSIYLKVPYLIFNYNYFTFTDTTQNCGCVQSDLGIEHTFIGNTFSKAGLKSGLTAAAGFDFDCMNNPKYKITIENNTFEYISGTNQGRCFRISSYEVNEINLIKNIIQYCPSGGPLFGILFHSQTDQLKIESFTFRENIIGTIYDAKYGCTPSIWIENPIDSNTNLGKELVVGFYDCQFIQNTGSNGGALNFGSNMYLANIKIYMYNCQFNENNADNDGGSLYIQSYQGIHCQNCNFTNNKSKQGKSSVYISTYFECKNPDSGANIQIPDELYRDPSIMIYQCNFLGNNKNNNNEICISNSQKAPIEISQCKFNDEIVKGFIISIDDSQVKSPQIKNCTFSFSKDNELSKAIHSSTNDISFVGNSFIKCAEKLIGLEDKDVNGIVQLIENNFIECKKSTILDITFKKQPKIEGNYFMNVELSSMFLVFRCDGFNTLKLSGNNFSLFSMSGEISGIGLQTQIISLDDPLHLIFEDCKFTKITCSSTVKNGGALCCESNLNEGKTYLTMLNCIFEGNKHNKDGSLYVNLKHEIIIEKCSFTENEASKGASIYIKPDYQDYSDISKITITGCNFKQNNPSQSSSVFIEAGKTKNLNINSCTFEEDYGLLITNFVGDIELIDLEFIKSVKETALMLPQENIEKSNHITIDRAIFDSCTADNNKCFYLLLETKNNIVFQNSVIKNHQATGVDNYIGTLSFKETSVSLENISFFDNVCDSLYGGGIGVRFIELDSLIFLNCKFINNMAKQNKEKSRPSINGIDYYNGDGGAIQLGYICKMNDMNVQFEGCDFINNKAIRHGGALAIQTYYMVKIEKCSFENNIANYKPSSSELLYGNYFNLKSDGRGGAIYLTLAFSYDAQDNCQPPELPMKNIDILRCDFKSNDAYDGYALYIDGDNPEALFSIKTNTFTDNSNKINVHGAQITTEVCSFDEKQINDDNTFTFNEEWMSKKILSCVDHYGNTPSANFSHSNEFSYSSPFTTSNAFIPTKQFSHSNEFSNTNPFTESKQFSQSSYFEPSNAFTASEQFYNPTEESSTETSELSSTGSSESSSSSTESSSTESSSTESSSTESSSTESSSTESSSTESSSMESSSTESSSTESSSMESSSTESSSTESSSTESSSTESSSTESSSTESSSTESSSTESSSTESSSTESSSAESSSTESSSTESSSTESSSTESSSTESSSAESSLTESSSTESSSTESSSTESSESESFTIEESESTLPTDPAPYPPGTSCVVTKNDEEDTLPNRCEYSESDSNTNTLISVIRKEFVDFKNESHGGAILIFNTGLYIHGVNFTRCISQNGGGGAIYIKDPQTLKYDIYIDLCFFSDCSALYGGACYIYYESETNNVTITNSTFTSNTATLKSSSGSGKTELFGGSAILLTAKNSIVEKCKFQSQKGSSAAFKIYNKFDSKKSNIISLMSEKSRQISNTISVSDCEFEVENGSESSIYYVGDRDGSDVEVKECLFKGKVDKGKNYIEEKLLTKDAPRLRIKSCEFEQMIDSVMNNNNIIIENERIHNEGMMKNILCVAAIVLGINLIIFILIKFICRVIQNEKDEYSTRIEDYEENFNKMIDDSVFENPLI